jgi:heat shock protein HtpX
MRRRRRAALLPPDRGLQARMVLAMLSAPALALGGVVAAFLFAPARIAFGVGLVLVVGAVGACSGAGRPVPRRALAALEFPAVQPIVERLCLLADLPAPEIDVHVERRPNSWIEAPSSGPARLHLTTGLLLLLETDELEAVIAHELSHLAHHDARVMSVVGGSGALLIDGAERARSWSFFVWPGVLAAGAIGRVSRLATLSFARHRELVADAGSAALTGRPAALARALRRISGELARVPAADLREAAARDVLHLLAVGDELAKRAPLRTHPPLERRIERLERLERALHQARPADGDVARGRADR